MTKDRKLRLAGGGVVLLLCLLTCIVLMFQSRPWIVVSLYPGIKVTRPVALGPGASAFYRAGSPIASTEIIDVRAQTSQSLTHDILDDDPTYSLIIDYRLTYADGTQALVRWRSFRYGLVLGPIVLQDSGGTRAETEYLDP